MKHKKLLVALIVVLSVFAILFAACWAFIADVYRADEAAVAALAPVPGIRVENGEDYAAFIPENAETGFIFYPGGRVEHIAYAPLMYALAGEGVLCVLPDMPMNLAFFDANAADDIPDKYPQVKSWYIGGHSLGGSMAASYASKHPDSLEGLVLLASYSMDDLSSAGLDVISVIASEDGVLNMDHYEDNKPNLPDDFAEHVIAGGCHAGFGSYGPQDGDGKPAISGEEQIAQTVQLLKDFFK